MENSIETFFGDFQTLWTIFIHVLLCSMQILCRYAGRLSGLLPQNPDISKIVFKNSKRLKKVKNKAFKKVRFARLLANVEHLILSFL